MSGVARKKAESRAMKSKSPAVSPALRNGRKLLPELQQQQQQQPRRASTKPIPLEGLARLSTDVYSEINPTDDHLEEMLPFLGVVICVTGFSRGHTPTPQLLPSKIHQSQFRVTDFRLLQRRAVRSRLLLSTWGASIAAIFTSTALISSFKYPLVLIATSILVINPLPHNKIQILAGSLTLRTIVAGGSTSTR